MTFNNHSNLRDLHAPFSPSQPSWLRYTDERAVEVFQNRQAAEMGTRLHDWAEQTINLGRKQPRTKETISSFINDAIGYQMSTEVTLYYSPYVFGRADAISFNRNMLRIHDLKTGKIPAHMEQPEIYEALFCLEYHIDPHEIKSELRLYQNDEITAWSPDPDYIQGIMEHIVHLSELVDELVSQGGLLL